MHDPVRMGRWAKKFADHTATCSRVWERHLHSAHVRPVDTSTRNGTAKPGGGVSMTATT